MLKDEWIKVTDYLPKHGQHVLATDGIYVSESWYEDEYWSTWQTGNWNVTHWLPLPSKPKEEKENESFKTAQGKFDFPTSLKSTHYPEG